MIAVVVHIDRPSATADRRAGRPPSITHLDGSRDTPRLGSWVGGRVILARMQPVDLGPDNRATLAARTGHALTAAVAIVGLIIQVALVLVGGTDVNSGTSGPTVPAISRLVTLLGYFTIQSNILVAVASVMLALDPLREGRVFRVLHIDALLGITITGVVFALVLSSGIEFTGWALVANACLHDISPVLTVGMWLFLGPRRRITGIAAACALIWPVGWLVCTFIRGAILNWYPYFFLDATALGLTQALVNALLVVAFGMVLLAIFSTVDRFAPAILGRAPHPQLSPGGSDPARTRH